MPATKGSTKAQIEKLTKELNLSLGTQKDMRAHIADLETRLASKIEDVAALNNTIDKMRAPVQENTDLKEALAALQVEFNEERAKVSRVRCSFDALGTVYDRATCERDRLKAENGALRAALKAVL
jgi:septal ring factor EnvC (AmiA/AmiB activator)